MRASINDVGLTGIVDLLGDIETSEYPVAVDHVQIEHYTPGDTFRAKVGVLTFDQTGAARARTSRAAGKSDRTGERRLRRRTWRRSRNATC